MHFICSLAQLRCFSLCKGDRGGVFSGLVCFATLLKTLQRVERLQMSKPDSSNTCLLVRSGFFFTVQVTFLTLLSNTMLLPLSKQVFLRKFYILNSFFNGSNISLKSSCIFDNFNLFSQHFTNFLLSLSLKDLLLPIITIPSISEKNKILNFSKNEKLHKILAQLIFNFYL